MTDWYWIVFSNRVNSTCDNGKEIHITVRVHLGKILRHRVGLALGPGLGIRLDMDLGHAWKKMGEVQVSKCEGKWASLQVQVSKYKIRSRYVGTGAQVQVHVNKSSCQNQVQVSEFYSGSKCPGQGVKSTCKFLSEILDCTPNPNNNLEHMNLNLDTWMTKITHLV